MRSERSADKAAKLVPGAAAQSFVRADVCDKQSLAAALAAEAGGYDAMVLLTSAVPKLKLLSLVPVLLSKLVPGAQPGKRLVHAGVMILVKQACTPPHGV